MSITRIAGFPAKTGQPILKFLTQQGPDHKGRTFNTIVYDWTDDQWEDSHDMIQTVFPLKERSKHCASAPILDDEEIQAIKDSQNGVQNLCQAFQRYLVFLGLEFLLDDSGDPLVIRPAANWNERSSNWVTHFNHNYLRITRVLHSLVIFDRQDLADLFLDMLLEIYNKHKAYIGATTLGFWMDATKSI